MSYTPSSPPPRTPLTLPPETHTRDHRSPITRFPASTDDVRVVRDRVRRVVVVVVATSRATATRPRPRPRREVVSSRPSSPRSFASREREREAREPRDGTAPDDDRPREGWTHLGRASCATVTTARGIDRSTIDGDVGDDGDGDGDDGDDGDGGDGGDGDDDGGRGRGSAGKRAREAEARETFEREIPADVLAEALGARRSGRKTKARVIMVDGEPVLRSNNYSLTEGEPSVFDKELGGGGGAGEGEGEGGDAGRTQYVFEPQKEKRQYVRKKPRVPKVATDEEVQCAKNKTIRQSHRGRARGRSKYLQAQLKVLEPFVTPQVRMRS